MTLEITKLDILRRTVAKWREEGKTIAFVPTMGALHAGHLALVSAAKAQADKVVVSIFVNPTQFGPNEDFHKYPRPLEADLEKLQAARADAAWLPSANTMYPEGFATSIQVAGIRDMLDGKFRPGHFDGVATVVAKLFQQVEPDLAFFGEKDYQQLCLIKRLVSDLDFNIKIVGVETLRELDGLALSSRNQYLDASQRKQAVKLNQVLRHTAYALREERDTEATLKKGERLLLDGGFSKVDYLALCDEVSLESLTSYKPRARLLGAAWLGTTRLIDNIAVEQGNAD